jgi:hypothetical protein
MVPTKRSAIAFARGARAGVLMIWMFTPLEQAITRRPNSYVPGRTLLALLGRHPTDDLASPLWNHVMHCGVPEVGPGLLTSGDRWSEMIPACRFGCCT